MNVSGLKNLIGLLDELEPWRLLAACRNMGRHAGPKGTDLFFPDGKATNQVRMICNGCPVQAECKAFAQKSKSDYGMWAGEMRDPDHRYDNPTSEERAS